MLAEIASSPAGQTDDPGPLDGPDLRVSHSELQAPTPGRAGLLNTPGESSLPGWLWPRGPWPRRCSVLSGTGCTWATLLSPGAPGGEGQRCAALQAAGSLTLPPPTAAAPTLAGDPHSPFPHRPATLGPLSHWLNVKPSKSAMVSSPGAPSLVRSQGAQSLGLMGGRHRREAESNRAGSPGRRVGNSDRVFPGSPRT